MKTTLITLLFLGCSVSILSNFATAEESKPDLTIEMERESLYSVYFLNLKTLNAALKAIHNKEEAQLITPIIKPLSIQMVNLITLIYGEPSFDKNGKLMDSRIKQAEKLNQTCSEILKEIHQSLIRLKNEQYYHSEALKNSIKGIIDDSLFEELIPKESQ